MIRDHLFAYDLQPGDRVVSVWHESAHIGVTRFGTESGRVIEGLRSALVQPGDIVIAIDNTTSPPLFTVRRDWLPAEQREQTRAEYAEGLRRQNEVVEVDGSHPGLPDDI